MLCSDHKMGRGSKTSSQSVGPFRGISGNGQSDQGDSDRNQGVSADVTPRSGPWGDVDKTAQSTWTGQDSGQLASSRVVRARCVDKSMEVTLLKSFITVRNAGCHIVPNHF